MTPEIHFELVSLRLAEARAERRAEAIAALARRRSSPPSGALAARLLRRLAGPVGA